MKENKIFNYMVDELKSKDLCIQYVQMRQNGEIVNDYKRPLSKTRLNMYSISKSVVASGIGIAVDEGLIDLDEYICDTFPDYMPENVSDNLLNIKVKHLLTMTSGLSTSLFFADNEERYIIKDWIEYFFNADFGFKPGEKFVYSNFNTYILGCLIERKSGVNLLEYLRYRFFEPIGIGNPDWVLCPKGHALAANGLYLNIDELGNFGEFLLNHGKYKGKQIVSESYMRQATTMRTESLPIWDAAENEEKHGYGYQIWMTHIPNTYLCYGSYGQFCLVMPDKNIIIGIMSLESNATNIREILLKYAAQM